MKRFFVLIALICGLSWGAEFNFKPFYTLLISENNGTGVIVDSDRFLVGSSGVVMHKFGGDLSSIVARAVVTEKKAGFATVRFEVFSGLQQKALPLPNFLPQAGDEVVLNFLYERSLIVTPNEEIYKEIVKAFPNITFVHPDVMAAYLSRKYKPNPTRDDFRRVCAQNAAGLIFFALDNEAVFVDCGSFEILRKFKSLGVSYYVLPFYTRVHDISAVFWDFDSAKINNYDKYYRHLLK